MQTPQSGGGGYREGGPTSYRRGFLKRRLPPIVLANLSTSAGSSGEFNCRVQVSGLSGGLFYLAGVCAIGPDADVEVDPVIDPDNTSLSSLYPADPGQFQITPFTDPPQNGKRHIWRPVFQDPTFTDHNNHPLAQQIPYAWSVDGDEADGFYVDVHVGQDAWIGENFNGQLVFTLVIEYNGAWWDTNALEKAISMVTIKGVSAQPDTIAAGGE